MGKNGRRVGVWLSVGLGVRVSVEPTPNPAESFCLSMFQLIRWSVFDFSKASYYEIRPSP